MMILKLTEKRQETSDVTSFVFEPDQPTAWKAGQYLQYTLPHQPADNRGTQRWFTNSAAPFEKQFVITTRISSDDGSTFKKALSELKVGDEIEANDIAGDFTLEDTSKKYVLIAGGIGITPFRSILKQLDFEGKQISATLIYANRNKEVVFKEELEAIVANNPDFKIHYVFSPELVDENKIKELVTDIETPIFYVSGPEPMVDSLGETLKNMGVPENHIKQDWFPGYPVI